MKSVDEIEEQEKEYGSSLLTQKFSYTHTQRCVWEPDWLGKIEFMDFGVEKGKANQLANETTNGVNWKRFLLIEKKIRLKKVHPMY